MFQVKKLLKYTQPPQIKCQSKPLIEYENESDKVKGNVLRASPGDSQNFTQILAKVARKLK